MTKIVFVQWVVILLAPLGLSCGRSTRLDSDIEEANRHFDNGEWKKAERAYLEFMKERDERPPRLLYNLGLTKWMISTTKNDSEATLKEIKKAERLLLEAEATSVELKVRAMSSYSLGHLYFETSRIQDAVGAYRNALEIEPNMTDAIHNLELSLRRLTKGAGGRGQSNTQDSSLQTGRDSGGLIKAYPLKSQVNPGKRAQESQSAFEGQHLDHHVRDRQRLLDRLERKSKKARRERVLRSTPQPKSNVPLVDW